MSVSTWLWVYVLGFSACFGVVLAFLGAFTCERSAAAAYDAAAKAAYGDLAMVNGCDR